MQQENVNKDPNPAVLIVSADVFPGKEDDFNQWYDTHHIPEFSGKMPGVTSVKRYFSKRGNPRFIAIYSYASFDDLKKSMASPESQKAGEDADKQVGVLFKSLTFTTYDQIYP
jgi:antibiotic biosynthesis monooxygenase (ABM) superfamily enzyme